MTDAIRMLAFKWLVDYRYYKKEVPTMKKSEGVGDHYVRCNLCHQAVPEISMATESAYRYHPACRPEVVAKREEAQIVKRMEQQGQRRAKHGEE